MWFHWWSPSQGGSADRVFPIPIYFKTNLTDPDPAKWYNFDFEHCGQVKQTNAQALAEWFQNGIALLS